VVLIRILIVDDCVVWRREVISLLESKPGFQIIGEASDGLEAVHKSAELQPDLILLDIGLPKFNGVEAARRILQNAPESKIVFLSGNSSPELVHELLNLGAKAYVLKVDAVSDLLPAIKGVFAGKRFVSRSFAVPNSPGVPRR
jgi:DNA-binding NarL/FixJ family response regulator